MYVCLSICLFVCLPTCLSVCLSVFLSVCLSACLSVCLSVCLPVCVYVCLSQGVLCCAGTPSLAAPGTIGAVLEKIAEVSCLVEGAEVTLEANPTEWQKFKCVYLPLHELAPIEVPYSS